MSDETQEEGCVADIFCGGPLVFDERIEADVQAAVADLEERNRREDAEIRRFIEAVYLGIKAPSAPDMMAITRDIARS